ncbi:MAG: DUF1501 domain-containing protein [Armatimonadetes bacterium]|nr:DUF1501 domain-containing protein [Armatimonadota bacterium]
MPDKLPESPKTSEICSALYPRPFQRKEWTVPSAVPAHRHTTGITRRELLQVGYSGLLGIGLPALLAQQASAAQRAGRQAGRKPKSLILIFLTGAPSHLDMFDLKPDAPAEIRGEFRPIATKVPGIQISEHLPRLAARADKYALVRSLAHRENNHLVATHHLLTGYPQPGAFFDKVASRDDWPCYAGALDYLRPRRDAIPNGVHLPTFLMEGPLTWPGQHAGILGPKHDPWQITSDPNVADFRVDSLRLAPGLEVSRLNDRQALLGEVDRQQGRLADLAAARRLSDQQQLAFSMLTSGKVAQAFEIHREPAPVRDRYGRHAFGQSLLLARRLVQAGVPVVQANMGRAQTWDSHGDIFSRLKDKLLPPLDQGVAALLDDLEATGLLEETLVMLLGEFGRTPKISAQRAGQKPGRDHWAPCFFGFFAGAGVRGGQVLGKSDKIGAFPTTTPYSPDDVGATVYHVLGVDPGVEVRDRQNRPVRLNRGAVMQSLFTGRTG